MWFGADRIAVWIGDPSTGQAVKAASLALWFTPVMAALRGYYQGRGRMLPSAVSQLSEQLRPRCGYGYAAVGRVAFWLVGCIACCRSHLGLGIWRGRRACCYGDLWAARAKSAIEPIVSVRGKSGGIVIGSRFAGLR